MNLYIKYFLSAPVVHQTTETDSEMEATKKKTTNNKKRNRCPTASINFADSPRVVRAAAERVQIF